MKKLVAVKFLFLALAACSSVIQPTPTVIPTFTAVPTQMASATQTLTMTLLPTAETPDGIPEPLPEDQPASEWNGIPIMPGAIAGEGDEEGYVFTIKATPQQVQEYYQLELGKRGWQPFPQSDSDSPMTLIYMNNESESLSISILAKEDEVLVLLVK